MVIPRGTCGILSPMTPDQREHTEQPPLFVGSNEIVIDGRFIDPYGSHLHHTGPLHLFEEERARIIEERGLSVAALAEQTGIKIFVHSIEKVGYKQQLYEGDTVTVRSALFLPRKTLLSCHQTLEKGGIRAVEAVVNLGAVNENGRPTAIPSHILDLFI
jgi:acyl-CoA thioesterase FadM